MTPRCNARAAASITFRRLVSRVAVLRGEDAHLEDMADPSSLAGLDEDDPKSLGRWLRKMSHEMGEDMPPEFDEVIDRLESGQSPEEIEESMPGLADDVGGFGGPGGNDFVDL